MRIAGVEGTVEDFTLRRTTLRDLDGVVHTVPNGEIHVASNLTRVWSRINQDVTVAYGTDIDAAIGVVDAVGREMADDPVWKRRVLEAPRVERISELGETGVTLKILGTVRAADQWAAAGDFRRRLLEAFKANGIEIARPLGDVAVSRRRGGARPAARHPTRTTSPRERSRGVRAAGPTRRGTPRRTDARYDGPASRSSRSEGSVSVEPPLPSPEIENLMAESRVFPPDPDVRRPGERDGRPVRRGRGRLRGVLGEARARDGSTGRSRSTTTLEWDLPFAKWFTGGELNVAYNCVDRHVERGLGDKVAYHWIGEPGDTRTLTFRDLQREVSKAANALKELGVKTGDRVAIYMPMIPELPIAMLACARIGAPHTVVFGGFSAEALSGRINDCGAKVLITADGGYRRGKAVGAQGPRRRGARRRRRRSRRRSSSSALGDDVHMVAGPRPLVARHRRPPVRGLPAGPGRVRAHALPALHVGHDRQAQGHPAHDRRLPRRHVVQPRRDLRHQARRRVLVRRRHRLGDRPQLHRLRPARQRDDRGPVRGRARTRPAWDRWWQIVEDYKVTILYCAPTAIRAFMKQGEALPAKHDLSTLRVLGSVGEPINPEAWLWYREHIGGDKAPVVDTWWQTETGQILITPLPGVTDDEAGFGDVPVPGHRRRRRRRRREVRPARWRRLPRPQAAVAGDAARHLRRPGALQARRTGAASRGCTSPATAPSATQDGYLWLLGRVDDVMNVAGHRISTTEVESALVDHKSVAEAAVVGKKDDIIGPGDLRVRHPQGRPASRPTRSAVQLREHVAYVIGPIARPKFLMFVPDLPKTRSGKIMRRLLRDIAEGRALGDTTTLADAARRRDHPRELRRGGGMTCRSTS